MLYDYLSDEVITRYSRNIMLPEIGGKGQAALSRASVLVVGAGGLGSPMLYYLAAAGVGRIGIVDSDVVELSNLQRQILHKMQYLGKEKVESARSAIEQLNPDIAIETYPLRLDSVSVAEIIPNYQIIADGSDNSATRYLVNDACIRYRKVLVSAAVRGFEGQLYSFKSYEEGQPCYRCLYPEAPETEVTCTSTGVLGAVTGVMGSLQATEIIKEILGAGDSMAGFMLRYHGLSGIMKKIRLHKDPECKSCAVG